MRFEILECHDNTKIPTVHVIAYVQFYENEHVNNYIHLFVIITFTMTVFYAKLLQYSGQVEAP